LESGAAARLAFRGLRAATRGAPIPARFEPRSFAPVPAWADGAEGAEDGVNHGLTFRRLADIPLSPFAGGRERFAQVADSRTLCPPDGPSIPL